MAEPDYPVRLAADPNDSEYVGGNLWALKNQDQSGGLPGADIVAPAGWELQSTASNTVVAVVDSGIHYTHDDLVECSTSF